MATRTSLRPLTLVLLGMLAACGGDDEPTLASDAAVVAVDASVVAIDAQLEAAAPSTLPALDAALAVDGGAQEAGPASDGANDATVDATSDAATDALLDAGPTAFERVYRIALRVHRRDSGLSAAQLAAALDEMNQIWWRQASICFEIDLSDGDQPRTDGFDLWFHRTTLGCDATGNGVYCGDHDIHTLDAPSLGSADNAQWDSRLNPARTSAHELGHGLRLGHYNGYADSNDSLMSSGRQGFKLHEAEVTTARARAAQKALLDTSPAPCAAAPR